MSATLNSQNRVSPPGMTGEAGSRRQRRCTAYLTRSVIQSFTIIANQHLRSQYAGRCQEPVFRLTRGAGESAGFGPEILMYMALGPYGQSGREVRHSHAACGVVPGGCMCRVYPGCTRGGARAGWCTGPIPYWFKACSWP